MRFALDINNNRIEVSNSGEIATCPTCKSEVIGKRGKIRSKHWSHKIKNCDKWHEPITEWHIKWQNHFPSKNREVTLFDKEKNEYHRAEIYLDNGLVIEIQNFPIKISEIKEREKFYGNNGLIWILNGENLIPNCELLNKKNIKKIEFRISIPHMFSKLFLYEIEEFKEAFFKTKTIKLLLNNKHLINFENFYSNEFVFKFNEILDFDLIEKYLVEEIKKICDDLFLDFENTKNELEFNRIIKSKEYYTNIYLIKKNWRKFIDEMEFPVFIDNIKGMNIEHIYWLQQEKLIQKNRFLKNYLNKII